MLKLSVRTGVIVAGVAGFASAQQPWVERVSVTSTSAESHGNVDAPALSGNGRFVAFSSDAQDLVPADLNIVADVFVRDRQLGTTERVSLTNTAGVESNGRSWHAAISGDGRFVAFTSLATNLTNNPDLNSSSDVFVHDRTTHVTRLVSAADLTQPSGGHTGAGGSYGPEISYDGRWVAYYSSAFDVVPPGVDSTRFTDAFLADLSSSTSTLVSLSGAGVQAGWHSGSSGYEAPGTIAVSDDGRFVVFESEANNLVPGAISGETTVYVRDIQLATTDVVAYVAPGQPSLQLSDTPSISGNGRFVVFSSRDSALVPNDTNNATDVFVRDLALGVTERVAVDTLGQQGASPGGLNLALVPKTSITTDGRFVAFQSSFHNLVPGDANVKTDIFVHDRQTGVTQLVSRTPAGTSGSSGSYRPSLSSTGDLVAFQSDANNLVAADLNASPDEFVARVPASPVVFCSGDGSALACPCGNTGGTGRGCGNSSNPTGAKLAGTGGTSVAADFTSLLVTGLPPGTIAAVFQGTAQQQGGLGAVFGDGLRCVGGTVVRLATRVATIGGGLTFGHGVAGDPHIASQGLVGPAGGVRSYQVFYRNTAPFCTSGTFNLTNGLEISWLP